MPNPPSVSLSKIKLGLSVVLVMAALAVMAFMLSVWGEARTQLTPGDHEAVVEYVGSEGLEMPDNDVLEEGVVFQTGENQDLGIYFEGADLVRLYPGTEVIFERVNLEATPIELSFVLNGGSVWVSDLQGVIDVTVNTERVLVQPEMGSTFMDYTEGRVTVFAAHHPARLSFLNESDEGSQEVINGYLLTESHQAAIQESSLGSSLGQLRYTKLTKDYPFVYFDEDQWEDEWVLALDADQQRLADVYTDFVSALRRYGDGGHDEGSFMHRLTEMYRAARSLLTLSDRHLMEIEEDEELALLYQALYLIMEGDSSTANSRLKSFEIAAADFENLDKLESLTRVFQSIYYGHAFYPAKEVIGDIHIHATPEGEQLTIYLMLLRERLMEVYDLLDQGERSEAKQALLQYNDGWQDLARSAGADLGEVVRRMTEERQILQNLLYREDTFYDMVSYDVLSVLEELILTLTAEEYDLNEERQAFIQDKIRVLDRLVELIDTELVDADEGSDLGYQLLSEANALMNDITKETAVMDYYQERLAELALMFEFINSPDFELMEGTFEQAFEAYLQKKDELSDLSEYILGLSGEEEATISLEEAQAQAESNFSNAGIEFTTLLPLGDTNYRLFSVEGGRVGLIAFEAKYDRETNIVYDLEVEGDVFSAGVRLEDLKDAVEEAAKEEEENEVVGDTEDSGRTLTAVEAFAIDLAETSLVAEGLEVEEDDISIVDLDKNLFRVMWMVQDGADEIMVEFEYDVDDTMASEIVGDVEGTLFVVTESVVVSELDDAVRAEWDLVQLELAGETL